MHPEMDKTETPTNTNGKSQVDNVVPNYTGIESRVATQVDCTLERLVAKEILAHVADS